MAIYSQILKEFHTLKENFFGPLVTVSTGFHCSLRMCCMAFLTFKWCMLVGNQHTAGNHDFLYITQVKTAADSKAE